MEIEKKYWLDMLDADSADFRVQQNAYINLQDFRFGPTSDKGFAEQLESVGGTLLIANALPSGLNYCIGVAEDGPNRRAVYFNWNDGGNHGIYCFDYVAAIVYIVLLNSQVTGGLNFDRLHLIHSARVENKNVYWTDDLNEPRRLNIDSGIKLNQPPYFTFAIPYTAPVSQSVIAWIRRQPGLPPSAVKSIDVGYVGNFVANEAFEFCYRYMYSGFELSTLSGLSNLVNFNMAGDSYNFTTIVIPLAEKIDQDVIQIDMVVRFLISGIYFIVKSWQKKVGADAVVIAAHNAGTMAMTYLFYNDRAGISLDAAYSVKPFDSVPLLCNTIETAKNRAFMGNFVIGYTTSDATSLAGALVTTNIQTDVTGAWYFFQVQSNCSGTITTNSIYVIDIQNISPLSIAGYYRVPAGISPPFPAHINFNNLVYVGPGVVDVVNYLGVPGCMNALIQFTPQGVTSIVDNAPAPASLVGIRGLKSDDTYQLAITFYDNAGRKAGILTNDSLKLLSPDRSYAQTSFTTGMSWTLSNANAVNEIPAWAFYYSIDLTKSLRTRFFLQLRAKSIVYAAKDSSNNYTFTNTAYASNLAGVAVDISTLGSYAMGYVFNKGDIIKLFTQNNDGTNPQEVRLSIVAQSAQWLVCQLVNLGPLVSTVKCLFEIYTPYQQQSNEPYWEQGKIYQVSGPGTLGRTYGIISDTLLGDITLLNRNDGAQDYLAEAMSPSDLFYSVWNTEAGRPNFIDTIGQVTRASSIAFSNTFISGSQTNGLSTFDALDTTDISPDFGAIMKLQLASKVQKIGAVMLAICSAPSTASLYLSENTLISQTGDSVVAQANAVIGSIHELKGEFGTLNPESVIEFRGNIYWYDVQNGKIIQYADNGLFPISNYKVSRFWNLFSNQYKSLSSAAIEALGSRPFVFGCADPHHGELLFTVPRVLASPPNGFLPDYPSKPYPFDIWDGAGKTIVYKLYTDPNHWQGSYSFTPDYMFCLENNLYGFKNGSLYLHNQGNYCQYYGTQYSPAVMCLSNQEPKKVKSYNNFSAQSTTAPAFTYFMSLYEFLQSSDLIDSDFKNLEGNFYASIYRNKLDPAFGNNFPAALIAGEKMRAQALYIMAQWDASVGIVQVQFLGAGFTLSLGQQVQRKGPQ